MGAVVIDDDEAIFLNDVELLDIGEVEVGCIFEGDNNLVDIGRYFSEVMPYDLHMEDPLLLLVLSLVDVDHCGAGKLLTARLNAQNHVSAIQHCHVDRSFCSLYKRIQNTLLLQVDEALLRDKVAKGINVLLQLFGNYLRKAASLHSPGHSALY